MPEQPKQPPSACSPSTKLEKMTWIELRSQQSETFGLISTDLISLASRLNSLNDCFTSLGEAGVDFDSAETCSKWLSAFAAMAVTAEAMTFLSRDLYDHARVMSLLQQHSSSATKSVSSPMTDSNREN